MKLTPTDNWMRAANSGSAEPILKFEFSPTVAYAECSGRADWQSGENVIELDTEHLSDELRLARDKSVDHPEQQLRQDKSFFPMMDIHIWENGVQVHDGATLGRLVQIFRSERSFKLKELRLSVHHNTQFTGRLIVKIVSGLSESVSGSSTSGGASHVDQVLENTKELGRLEINYGGNDPIVRDDDTFATWVVYDFRDQNVWIPGGDVPCAIVLEPAGSYKPTYLEFRGSPSSSSYAKGCLYWGIPSSKQYWLLAGQLSFKFAVDAYAESGSGEWLLDLGQAPPAGSEGELELRYCEPEGTRAVFELAEADSAGSFGTYTKYNTVSDGSGISKRYVKIRLTMYSDSLGIDTPRVRSIRTAFKRRINWLLASRPVFGYPNLVAEAPDYSAEGDPLSGSGAATDTSRIVLLDAGGMVSDLFADNYMKNDRVRIWLGFDVPYFRDSQGKDPGDWLPFKTVWIEDWQPGDASMTVHCYDQQIRFRQAQAPVPADPPSQTEHICYDRANPVAIKYDLLRRAGIRPVEIDFFPAVGTLAAVSNDNGSFARLAAAVHGWEMNYAISSATSLERVDSELNRHLLAFQLVDERGRWVVRYADFGCVYDPNASWLQDGAALPVVDSDSVAAGSETFYPGMKYLRNWGLVYFGGEGGDESTYAKVMISAGAQSAKANKENASDKLLSAFIPADKEDQAREVALRRRLLQQQGLRTVQFTTGLRYAGIQIGEHINFNSKFYSRPGAVAPNPLLVMVTRKNIDHNLASINWAGVVLLDAEQVADEEHAVAAPASLTVTPQGDGTALWQWPASNNETASGVERYELFQRLSNLRDWGAAVASVTATGGASYDWTGSAYQEALQYDFGVRAVHSSGVFSGITVCENVVLTGPVPATPGTSDWELRTVPGTITVAILNPIDGATRYNVYAFTNTGWQIAGSFLPGQVFGYDVPEPFSRKVYLLSITAVNKWGESGKAALKVKLNEPLNPGEFVPDAPQFDSAGGTYPLVSRVPVGPYQAFSITLKLIPPSQHADMIERYEIERRDNGGQEGQGWTAWERLPDHQVKLENDQAPSPLALFYDNTDRRLTPGYSYQYHARAVSRWGVAGAWSNMASLLLLDDTTGPDQPVIAVYNETGRILIEISEPSINGGPCPDFSHFVIEGNPDGQGWQVLDPHWTSTLFYHSGPDSDLEVDWVYRVSAVDYSGNVSPVSQTSAAGKKKKAGTTFLADSVLGTGTPGTLSQITQNAQEIDLRVQYDEVINSVNVSTEGIRINASRLSISGSTEFASGYDPNSKLESTGGRYDSSSSGARVRIFPDDNTGIQVTDGTSDVFKCVVGGTDVGDVVIGSMSGQHVMWDKSAGALEISGILDASGGIKTGTGNDRIELGKYGSTDQIKFYTGGSESGWIKSDSGELTLKMLSGSDYHYITRHGFGIYKSGGYVALLSAGVYSELSLQETGSSDSIRISTNSISGGPYLAINGNKVVQSQQSPISNPSETVSSNNGAIISILDALRTHGIIDT